MNSTTYSPAPAPTRVPFSTKSLKCPGFRAWYHPEMAATLDITSAESLTHLLQDLLDPQREIDRHLKVDRYCTVDQVSVNGQPWVVKRHHSRPWKTGLLQLIHRSHAWREWRGARKASATQARIVYPLALIHHPEWGKWTQTVIFPFVEGQVIEKWLRQQAPEDQWTAEYRAMRLHLARQIGSQIARFTSNGYVNRDYKATNLMLDSLCLEQGEEPALIDLDGVKPRYYEYKVLKMFRILYITTQDFGYVNEDEIDACLHAALEADPSIAKGQSDRAGYVKEQIRAMLEKEAAPDHH